MLKGNNNFHVTSDASKSGFTLVELIVVIVVLGILAAIGIPRYNSYVNDSRLAHIKADMKTISGLIEVTAMDDDGVFRDGSVDDLSELEKAISEGRVYKEGNLLLQEDYAGGDFHVIKDTFIISSARSKLKGTFLVDNNDEVYYIADKRLKGSNKPEEEPNNEGKLPDDDCPIVDFGNMIPIDTDMEQITSTPPDMVELYGPFITLGDLIDLFKADRLIFRSYRNTNDGETYLLMFDFFDDEFGEPTIVLNVLPNIERLQGEIDEIYVYAIISKGEIEDFDGNEDLIPTHIQDNDKNGNLRGCPRLLVNEKYSPGDTGEDANDGGCETELGDIVPIDIPNYTVETSPGDSMSILDFIDTYREINTGMNFLFYEDNNKVKYYMAHVDYFRYYIYSDEAGGNIIETDNDSELAIVFASIQDLVDYAVGFSEFEAMGLHGSEVVNARIKEGIADFYGDDKLLPRYIQKHDVNGKLIDCPKRLFEIFKIK